ncbi:beta family protein [Parvibaculum sp.]|uniref:beta family protein n=1 Tax=Parvibaculum sp. TaxID=2024848 RepID=UPI00391CA66F
MKPKHITILKGLSGEFAAVEHLDSNTAGKLLPLFEIERLGDRDKWPKYLKESPTPTATYLQNTLGKLQNAWGTHPVMVDAYHWSPKAQVENGEHVIPYAVRQLQLAGMPVIPVIGYDRWETPEYQLALQNISPPADGHYCIRLDPIALDDAAEPELFRDTIDEIVDTLELTPADCSVLIDFGDISASTASIEVLISKASSVLLQLAELGFRYYSIAGCSLPDSVPLAVHDQDSSGMVLRKEMLVWQALRHSLPTFPIVSGDYGVRGPTTVKFHNPHMNGKIRHTIQRQTFLVRGHAISKDGGKHSQMPDLVKRLKASGHFLGANFSWGDQEIAKRTQPDKPGNPTQWISYDTNHHLTFVVQEVEEFEASTVVQVRLLPETE